MVTVLLAIFFNFYRLNELTQFDSFVRRCTITCVDVLNNVCYLDLTREFLLLRVLFKLDACNFKCHVCNYLYHMCHFLNYNANSFPKGCYHGPGELGKHIIVLILYISV